MKNKELAHTILAKFRFDPWNLMGPRNRETRRELLLAITGQRRPLAKCGVTEIEAALTAEIDVANASCKARWPEVFADWFELPDSRYSVTREFTGCFREDRIGKACHVARFCGEWIDRRDSREEAVALCRAFEAKRQRDIESLATRTA